MKVSLVALFCLMLLSAVNAAFVTAKGRVVCDGQGLPYTRITLLDDDIIADKKMGSAITDSSGYFTVSGSASDVAISKKKRRPDVRIRSDLEHSSVYGSFEVKRPVLKGKEKSSTLKDREGDVNFGTINFNSDACKAYLRFYNAIRDFYTRVGYRLPLNLKINTEVLVHGGTPYALYDDIKIPKGYHVSTETAIHELAHTVRHRYDGSLTHFVGDAAKYFYTQRHTCTDETNYGFAFNEGWAEYWAGTCTSNSASGTKKVEGNVASALRELQSSCKTSDHDMWEVLRKNAKSIHSYSSYESKHKALYKCP